MSTKTKQVLDQLAKAPQTLEQLVEATGLDIEEVRRAIWWTRFNGFLHTEPEVYSLTAKGQVKQMRKPKTPPAVIAKKAEQRRERKARVEQMKDSTGLVEMSIQRNAGSALFNLGRSM